MKNILAILILGTTTLFAQVPQGFNYQAALRDAAGAVLSSQPVSVKIELSQGAITYTEIHNLTTNAVGLINLTVGYTPQAGGVAFSNIDWNAGGVSMTTSYDPAGGTNWTLVGTSILQSVPYALSAANGFSGDFNDLTNVPSIDTSSVNELQSLSTNGDTIKLSQGGSVYFQRFSGVFNDLTGVPTLDTSNTNEIQNLSRNGDTLRLSNGGMVLLPLSLKAEKINDLTDGFASGTSLGLGTGALLNTALTGINNTAVGQNNLSSNTGGSNNTAVGSEALKLNASGSQNTAVGQQAMNSNINGNNNTALGSQALKSNTSGSSNVALGHDALSLNSTGDENTAVGKNALKQATAGSRNTAVGFEALSENTTGFSNVAIGWRALKSNKSGIQNTAIGRMALMNSKQSTNNTALGEGALHTLEIDSVISNGNTALGNAALYRLKEGQRNVAIGSDVGAYYEKGSDNIFIGGASQGPTKTLPVWNNVAIGSGSGNNLDSNSYQNILLGGNTGNMLRNGFANTALGFAAMQMMTKGHYNVAVGIQAMQMSNVQTSSNTAVGAQSLVNVKSSENTAIGKGSQNQTTTGGGNTSVGASSLNSNTTGAHNVAMGVNSLYSNTTGFANTSMGTYSLNANQTGQENVAVGFSAMAGNLSGSSNTAVGLYTLYGYQGLTGSYNTALGAHVLTNTKSGQGNTGIGYWVFPNLKAGNYNIGIGNNVGLNVRGTSENILIGHESNVKDSMVTNSIAIGYQAVAKSSNAVQLGNSSTTTVSTNGRFEGKGGSLRDSSTIGDNAILRLSSNTKGFVFPTMTFAERQAVSPEVGMAIYCKNCGGGGQLQIYNGVVWTDFTGAPAAPQQLAVGDMAFGGVVAYLLTPADSGYSPTEQHGIVIAMSDLAYGMQWGCMTLIPTSSKKLKGLFNQQRYNALCQSSSTIAMGTFLLVLNGNNTNWFLPSKDDLAVIYANRSSLSQYLQTGTYWSSTDNGNGAGAWCLNLTTGYSATFLKNDTYHRTKPIKYF